MGTAIGLLILAVIVGIAVKSMVKDKKAGKSFQCGQDCKHCGGHCH
ncbi:MAG: FeoB-associated Cys-rich membrane protein [Brotaphodocola sp.]